MGSIYDGTWVGGGGGGHRAQALVYTGDSLSVTSTSGLELPQGHNGCHSPSNQRA